MIAQAVDLPPLVCAGCTKCCRDGELIVLTESDDPSLYQTVKVFHPLTGEPALAIEPTGTGACRYISADSYGCSIYHHRPAICRAFDCSKAFVLLNRAERRRRINAGLASRSVFDQGRAKAIERGMIP